MIADRVVHDKRSGTTDVRSTARRLITTDWVRDLETGL